MADKNAMLQQDEQQLQYIQMTQAALAEAKKQIDVYRTKEAAVQQLIPKVVEALIQHRRIEPQTREKAASALRDPEAAMKTLIFAADPNETVNPRPIGDPTLHTKEASTQEKSVTPEEVFDEILLGR